MNAALVTAACLLLSVTLIIRRMSRARFSQRERPQAWAFSLIAALLVVHIVDLCAAGGWTFIYRWRHAVWPPWTNSLMLAACFAGLVAAGSAGDKLDKAIRIYDSCHKTSATVMFGWSILVELSSIYMLGFAWWEKSMFFAGRESKPTEFCVVLGLLSTLPWLPLFGVDLLEFCYSTIAEWLQLGPLPRPFRRKNRSSYK